MRILLDENTPAALADSLPGHEVTHVDVLGLKSLANGELLEFARREFDCLITLDKGLPHQHNHAGHRLILLVIRVPDSRKETVLAKAPLVAERLSTLMPGEIVEIE